MLEPKLQNDVTKLEPIMQELLKLLAQKYKFKTVECCRTLERQKWLVANGKSWTLNSNHIKKSAADLYPLAKGYDTSTKELNEWHDTWDELVNQYHKDGFVVIPEPRIQKDLTHFGCFIAKTKKL